MWMFASLCVPYYTIYGLQRTTPPNYSEKFYIHAVLLAGLTKILHKNENNQIDDYDLSTGDADDHTCQ